MCRSSEDFWLCFRPDVSDEEARMAFEARYGEYPEQVTHEMGLVRAGPIPVEKMGRWELKS